jgi:hypothetical protein
MKSMRVIKEAFLILIILALLAVSLFSRKIINLIPSNKIIFVAATIYLLGLALFIFLTYRDITRKQYTTTLFIVVADIIAIIYFAVIAYMIFIGSNETDILELAKMKVNISKAALLFAGVLWGRSYVKSEKFRKKQTSKI